MSRAAMDRAEFEQALRDEDATTTIHHPFHVAIARRAVPVANRSRAGWRTVSTTGSTSAEGRGDLANCPDREVQPRSGSSVSSTRRRPRRAGSIEAWLRLAEAVGLEREQVLSEEQVLCPALRSPSTPTSTSPVAPVDGRRRAIR
ncbi:hypothetical protein P4233_22465 [Pseudomonas aeruginosa]|nr:hypothetical protein [Pseudomonas aeruginosa]